jgi:hypothetical protein
LTTDVLVRRSSAFRPRFANLDLRSNLLWLKAAFAIGWEVQSQVASLAFLMLVAFAPLGLALGAMIVWSILATVCYYRAREAGYPDLFARDSLSMASSTDFVRTAGFSIFKAWLVGFQAFASARAVHPLLSGKNRTFPARLLRFPALALGLTLFGVSAGEHLLRTSGISGGRLLRMGLLAPFLNVPYRILVSAAVVHAAMGLLNLIWIE